MSKLDFQNGFALGLASGGIVESGDNSRLNAFENYIDESGVLDGKEETLNDKVKSLIDATKIRNWFQTNFIDAYPDAILTNFAYNNGTITDVPLVDFSKRTNLRQAFYRCYALESIPAYDCSSATDVERMFYECYALKEVPKMKGFCKGSKITNFSLAFSTCKVLKTIGELDLSNATNISAMFSACFALENISFVEGSIRESITFQDCKLLSNDSKQSIFDGLATVTTAQTLTLPADVKILQSQVDSANAKGWTVAGGTVVSEEEYYG